MARDFCRNITEMRRAALAERADKRARFAIYLGQSIATLFERTGKMGKLSRRDALLQLAFAGTGAIAGVASPAVATAVSPRNRALDAMLQAAVNAGDAPGVVAMVATDRTIIYEGAFGFRAQGAPARMSTDTIFRIASMVKLITSVAAMQLVERGKLTLDDPAENIDPTLASPVVLTGFDDKGAPQLRPATKPLTLRNLLTHTSGFSYPLWNADLARYLKYARDDKSLPRKPLVFDPGTRWAYGGSIDRVGRLIEITSGKPLDR